MKRYLFIISSFFAILAGCEKDSKKNDSENIFTAEGKAIKNGENWSAKTSVQIKNDTMYINLHVFITDNVLSQLLGFVRIPLAKGSYRLSADRNHPENGLSSFATLQGDGDVSCDLYRVDTTVGTNYIRVVALDTIQKTIRCEFNCSYLIDTTNLPKCDLTAQNRISFSNGVIWGKYR